VSRVRKGLALDQLADMLRIDARIKDINRQLREAVKATSTGPPQLFGVGTVTTALLRGEVKDVARFKDRHHFASYNGGAPVLRGSSNTATSTATFQYFDHRQHDEVAARSSGRGSLTEARICAAIRHIPPLRSQALPGHLASDAIDSYCRVEELLDLHTSSGSCMGSSSPRSV
jgi:hypothetical protein